MTFMFFGTFQTASTVSGRRGTKTVCGKPDLERGKRDPPGERGRPGNGFRRGRGARCARAEILGRLCPRPQRGGCGARPAVPESRALRVHFVTARIMAQNFPGPGARPTAGKFWKPPPRVAGRRLRAAPGEPQNFPGRAAYSRRPRPELNPRGKPFS